MARRPPQVGETEKDGLRRRLSKARQEYESAAGQLERAREERRAAAAAAHAGGLTWKAIAEQLGLNSPQEAERLTKPRP